jgi:leader peptidase (prepilin peptidase) / N-methyltransferase
MIAFEIVIAVLFGLLVGSFLNVCIDRLPAGQSIVKPPSHCPACNRRLAAIDLLPVVSYLTLRGRCRYCGARIPLRLMWVEIGTGVIFGYLVWHFGISVELLMALIYTAAFIVLSVIDFNQQIILSIIVYPGILLALAVSFFISPARLLANSGDASFLPGFLPQAGFLQAAIGLGVGALIFLLIVVLARGGMGWGDVSMAGFIGAVTGYLLPLAILLAVIIGGLLAVFLLVFKLKKRKEGIPFGPFLAIGGLITILWGNGLAGWYLGFWK